MNRQVCLALAAGALLLAACGDSGGATTTTTTTAEGPAVGDPASAPDEPLRVLVTNDDGVGAPGIDALVGGLVDAGYEVHVVAPAENRSGSGDMTSETPPAAADAQTASGHEAVAVDGFPADAVNHALDDLGLEPHLVVSGINEGQNIGVDIVKISGTVGAAQTAARAGVPALAVSQGIADEPDFPAGVDAALRWIEERLDRLFAGSIGTDDIANLNVPTCAAGDIRPLVVVPPGEIGDRDITAVDCESAVAEPVDDVEALTAGFVSLSVIPAG